MYVLILFCIKLFRAAAIAVFHFDFVKSCELLEKIKPGQQFEESKFILSILVGMKNIQKEIRNNEK